MNRTFSDGARRLWSGYQPLTNTLLAACVLIFLCDFVFVNTKLAFFSSWLNFTAPTDWLRPWRLLTYPLVTGNIISLIFDGYLLWMVGGSLERSWGTKTFAIFYLALSLVTALAFTFAAFVVGGLLPVIPVPGILVLAAMLVGFCCLNPDESMYVYMIPIRMRFLAAGVCIIIFFSLGFGNPFLGLMAIVGCGFAVLWVKQGWAYAIDTARSPVRAPKIPQAPKLRLVQQKSHRPRDDRFTIRDLNPFEWLARRKRRKQFEKLINDD